MKYSTVLLLALVGPAQNYAYLSLALFFIAIVRNKVAHLKGYLHLAEQNRKLEETNEELVRINTLKDRLLSILSHDIRSPLNSFRSFMHLLIKRNLTEKEIHEVLRNLDHQTEQLSNFLENVLRWTKNHFDQINPKPEKIELSMLVKETVALLSLSASGKEVRIRSEVPEKVMIYADAEMVKIVLRNLISNAIKFCKANDMIYIQSKEEQDMVRVSVKDTGRGISEDNIQKLFNLSQLSTNGTKGEIGTGLGLALCREFIEIMGGEIRATSIEGHGSCFEFTIPSLPY